MRAPAASKHFFLCTLAALLASVSAPAQTSHRAHSERRTIASADKSFEIRYPPSLLVCAHRDGENPDVWSPKACAAEIPVCDSSGHAENVLACLAYPMDEFNKSNLQAAALAVSRLENLSLEECAGKWPRANTSNVHTEQIAGNTFRAASAQESANNFISEQTIYRVVHDGACYEVDLNFTSALDAAFAVEDAPRKLAAAEREKIRNTLLQALRGFRFVK
ncbi:MAG TPA: hypothetical protein VMH04_22680 [Candidatus Solibacter sp.]|nr:hypothetical protein [Candidatus Solibacter sp.]